nr:MAG TPA: hypothetical protein [Caudoviricetes sp.]
MSSVIFMKFLLTQDKFLYRSLSCYTPPFLKHKTYSQKIYDILSF